MQKSKGFLNEVSISGSRHSSCSSCNKEDKKKTKSIHPPIEHHWHIQPVTKESRKSKRSLLATLSHSFLKFKSSTSMKKRIIEGPHDPTDEKKVESLRELLFVEGQLSVKHYDYHTLLRFLRMRDFDVHKAKDMFLQYIKWRDEFNVDSLAKDFKYDEIQQVKNCYPHGYHGVDRTGRPVYIERLGMIDFDTFLRLTTIERFDKYHVSEQEKTVHWRYPACSLAAKRHIASTLSILDAKNVGPSRFSRPARHLFLEIQKIDSNYYPETLHQLFIINAGLGFKVLWKAIKAFLDARTLAKIRVLGSDYKSTLLEAIDPRNLPSFLGGECTCAESGGCLFSDKGPWNDPNITETLKGMLDVGDDEEGEMRSNASDGGDISDNPSLEDETVKGTDRQRNYVDKRLLKKFENFEHFLEDAQDKIKKLEKALEDTKMVLQGLAKHIQEFKR